LKNLDEQFKDEGIDIPYPTSVEINTETVAKSKNRRKNTSIRMARMQMIKEDKQLAKERASAKSEIENITEKLNDPELDRTEKQAFEEEIRELNKILGMFEAGGDD
jgi:uncharacterized protein YlxW (UPF0749 family)